VAQKKLREEIAMEDWIRIILDRERQCHLAFFGQEFDLSKFQQTLEKYGKERIDFWQSLSLEPHFLPPVAMSENADFPGWKIKPEDWYYKRVAEGQVQRRQPDVTLTPDKEAFRLEGITVLINTRPKPESKDSILMFENDNLLGPIMERLRHEGKIHKHPCNPPSSRVDVWPKEQERHVKPALAEFLGVQASQIRLERIIEANVIPQMYPHMPRKNDGNTKTTCWYEEYIKPTSCRSCQSQGGYGNLDLIICTDPLSGKHTMDRAIRYLVVLDS
jgi:hypothetical protein